jgi:hypothetical protein
LLRRRTETAGRARFDLFGFPRAPKVEILEGDVTPRFGPPDPAGAIPLTFEAPPGVTSFRARLTSDDWFREISDTLVVGQWQITFFPWAVDPREHLSEWRGLADGPKAVHTRSQSLDFPYGWRGPADLAFESSTNSADLGPDHFGMIARIGLRLPAGRWRFATQSDDGVRVSVNGRNVIENWTWHGPTSDAGVYQQEAAGDCEIQVEHFEIDGYAVLRLTIEPDRPK